MKRRPTRAGRVHAIVPLNVLRKSKARLSPMLKPVEREQLTVAMLKDVLSVLRKSRQVGSVTVVSADKNARSISRRFGANFLWEGKRRGLNKGLKLAISDSERRGASSVLVIHSDLPLLKPREIDEFLEESQGYSVSLTPSKDGAGTNALLMRPPRVIRPVFGRDSFRRHLSLAMKRNARSRVLRFRGISFDVDKPRDLVNLMRRPLRNETGKFLRTLRKRS
ncbi:MAG: 2-phospho-L-lactate guanylyltransferase [Candidatus Bathyarchaeia archaeon]